MNIVDFATLTVSSTSVGLEGGSPVLSTVLKANPGCRNCLIVVQTDSVYMRNDGDAATSAGIILYPGDTFAMIDRKNGSIQAMRNVRFLRLTSDAALKIIYYD